MCQVLAVGGELAHIKIEGRWKDKEKPGMDSGLNMSYLRKGHIRKESKWLRSLTTETTATRLPVFTFLSICTLTAKVHCQRVAWGMSYCYIDKQDSV